MRLWAEATRVFADGQAMLKKIIEGRWLQASGVMALYPANSVGDDIEFYTDESRSEVLTTWYGLRQQTEKHAVDGVMRPSRCLADFVAPAKDSGIADYAGLFAVTAGLGVEKKEKPFWKTWTTIPPSCSKSLADRLAEAFAECLHQRVRTDLWGYAKDEACPTALIAESTRASVLRPATRPARTTAPSASCSVCCSAGRSAWN